MVDAVSATTLSAPQVGSFRHPRPLVLLLVSSSGGVLLDILALKPWWSRHETRWAVVKASDTEDVLADQNVDWLPELSEASPLAMLPALFAAWRLLRRHRPDVIVSAGSGVAVPLFAMARLLRTPAVWVETFNIVGRPGISSRICQRLAAKVIVQRPDLISSRPNAVLVGELY